MATVSELLDLAIRHQQNGNLERAGTLYQQVLQREPANADALHLLGTLAQQAGNLQAAASLMRQAVALNPTNAHAQYNLGIVLQHQGQLVQASERYREVLRLHPDHADAHSNLGVALKNMGQLDEAESCFREALRANPNHAGAYNNLGNLLVAGGDLTEARECYRQARRINPRDVGAHSNLGIIHKELGELAEAEACYRQALALDPKHGMALWNQAFLNLLQGNWGAGWPGYEQRWARFGMAPRSFAQPRWTGAPLSGRTILVYAEQGLGDSIQFARFLPLVKARGGQVVFECPPALVPLLADVAGADQIVPQGQVLPPFAVQIPLLSLPGLFGTMPDTIPGTVPYVRATPQHVERWRNELAGRRGLKVGIVWQGNLNQGDDRQRSVPLTQFAPLAGVPDVQLISLQVGPGQRQLTRAQFPILDLGRRFDANSLEDVAAVIANLDLVVTVCTSVAHLAGAMGVPTWLALNFVPHWCWLLERADSPWYPTMRLFRQTKAGAWPDVFSQLAQQLAMLSAQFTDRK